MDKSSPNLLAHVVHMAGEHSFSELAGPGRRKKMKEWLGKCTLVCRIWASSLRPHLLHDIFIYSEADVGSLLNLMRNQGPVIPPLADCLQAICIFQSGPWSIPWIHRLSHVHAYTSQELKLGLWVRNIWDARKACGYLQGSLPCTLPGSTFALQCLSLEDVHFSSVAHLLRSVRFFPSLTWVGCRKLSFVDARTQPHAGQLLLMPARTC